METNVISYNSAMASGEALAPLAPLAWKSAEGLLAKMSNEGGTAALIAAVQLMVKRGYTSHCPI